LYSFLCRFIPECAVNAIMLLWYLLLCVLIFVLSAEPDTGFLYLGL
jgi:hypothetical protein